MVCVRWVLKQTQRAEASNFFTAISQRNKGGLLISLTLKLPSIQKKHRSYVTASTYWSCDTVILSWYWGVCRKCDSKFLDKKSTPWCSLYNPCCNAVIIIILNNIFVVGLHGFRQITWRISQIVSLKLQNFCKSLAHIRYLDNIAL